MTKGAAIGIRGASIGAEAIKDESMMRKEIGGGSICWGEAIETGRGSISNAVAWSGARGEGRGRGG